MILDAILPDVHKDCYRVEASVLVEILENDCEGATVITVDPGRLCREEVLFIALHALINEMREAFIPSPLLFPQ